MSPEQQIYFFFFFFLSKVRIQCVLVLGERRDALQRSLEAVELQTGVCALRKLWLMLAEESRELGGHHM